MRHRHPLPIPESRRTCVVRVDDDPDNPDRVIVRDTTGNRATMTLTAFWVTCRFAPGAVVDSRRVWSAE